MEKLQVGSLPGILVAGVVSGPAGSFCLSCRLGYGNEERRVTEDSIGVVALREWRKFTGGQPTWYFGKHLQCSDEG